MFSTTSEQIQRFLDCLFEPGDILEVRYLSDESRGFSQWETASKLLTTHGEAMLARNRSGKNVYIGANPRTRFGVRGDDNVALARSLFVDFDKTTVDEAAARIRGASLLIPTLLLNSGHGVHAYWRLNEAVVDLASYRQLQQRLAQLLGGDSVVCNPERVMRLPGFVNHKPPVADAVLIDADTLRRYNLASIEALLPPLAVKEPKSRKEPKPRKPAKVEPGNLTEVERRAIAYLEKIDPAIQGEHGSDPTFHAARSVVYGFDLGVDAGLRLLLAHYNPRCQPPWSEGELRHKCEDADSKPYEKPRGHLRDSEPDDDDDSPLRDLANARQFIERHGEDLRYVAPWKKWIVWNGQHWKVDVDGEVERRRNAWIDSLGKKGEKLGNLPKLSAMLIVASTLPGVPVEVDALDVSPDLLNCPNGTVNLVTGELRPHDRADMITKMCPVPYDPLATCPRWDRFLLEVMGGSSAMADYLARAVGYSLTGNMSEQVMFICYGDGSNGKGVFFGTLLQVIGNSYSMTADPSVIMTRRSDGVFAEKMDFIGRRFVEMSETQKDKELNEALVKQMTGGDRIRGSRKFENPFEYSPTHKMWLACNHLPRITGTDHGIWRRFQLIPWKMRFPVDNSVQKELAGELPGILAWAVRGCMAWRQQRLNPPAEVAEALREYRYGQDDLSAFIGECCDLSPSYSVGSAELRSEFTKWLGHSQHPPTPNAFDQMMKSRGYQKIEKNRGRFWLGLQLRSVGLSTPGTVVTVDSQPVPPIAAKPVQTQLRQKGTGQTVHS